MATLLLVSVAAEPEAEPEAKPEAEPKPGFWVYVDDGKPHNPYPVRASLDEVMYSPYYSKLNLLKSYEEPQYGYEEPHNDPYQPYNDPYQPLAYAHDDPYQPRAYAHDDYEPYEPYYPVYESKYYHEPEPRYPPVYYPKKKPRYFHPHRMLRRLRL